MLLFVLLLLVKCTSFFSVFSGEDICLFSFSTKFFCFIIVGVCFCSKLISIFFSVSSSFLGILLSSSLLISFFSSGFSSFFSSFCSSTFSSTFFSFLSSTFSSFFSSTFSSFLSSTFFSVFSSSFSSDFSSNSTVFTSLLSLKASFSLCSSLSLSLSFSK